jgi:23S rRNA (uracil1939-C5)-methyltransferase
VQAEVLYEKVKEFAGVSKGDTVFDLYCGTGTIGLYLASQAKNIVGIETVAQAVADAKVNAAANGIDNAMFLCGEADAEISRLFSGGSRADVVVVDPPRKGCEARLLSIINDMKPSKIIYVSCNQATLARDLALLCKAGQYKIAAVQPVDMFPWTGHVETVILLQNLKR